MSVHSEGWKYSDHSLAKFTEKSRDSERCAALSENNVGFMG